MVLDQIMHNWREVAFSDMDLDLEFRFYCPWVLFPLSFLFFIFLFLPFFRVPTTMHGFLYFVFVLLKFVL